MKTKYLVKLNGKIISTRVKGKKAVCLNIYYNEKTGAFKSVDAYNNVWFPKKLVKINDNPNVIFCDWNVFTKVGDNYEANFIYSANQQKIDIKKKQLNKKGN